MSKLQGTGAPLPLRSVDGGCRGKSLKESLVQGGGAQSPNMQLDQELVI